MDPVSVAGLAIGVASITFQIFSGCVKGYELLINARDFPKKFDYLRHRLLLEQYRFLDWAVAAGLNDSSEVTGNIWQLDAPIIVESLRQIESLLLNLEQMSSKYQLLLLRCDEFAIPVDDLQQQPLQKHSLLVAKALATASKMKCYPAKLRLKTLNADRFQDFLNTLSNLNTTMVYFLDIQQKKANVQMQESTFMEVLRMNSQLDDLQSLVRSLEGLTVATNSPTSDDKRHLELTQFKALSVAIATGHVSGPTASLTICGPRIPPADPLDDRLLHLYEDVSLNAEFRTAGRYDQEVVWVEWREYKPSAGPMPPEYMVNRMSRLALLLQGGKTLGEFSIPRCLGYTYLAPSHRIGLVFRGEGSITQAPQSLHDMLASNPKPSLSQRIQLAVKLTTSLWYLHAAEWVHKAIRSHNVLFENAERILDPSLAGFDYARPSEPNAITDQASENCWHELYRHPDVQFDVPRDGKYGFRKMHDMYALGVVLFEVGIWQRIDGFVKAVDEDGIIRRPTIKAMKTKLLSAHSMGTLAAEAGKVYSECVSFCLSQDRGKSIAAWLGDEERLHKDFELQVLEKLRSIHV